MRKAVAAILVLLIVIAGWWYASPIWTLREMRDAAKTHDSARFSAYVDYPALRESLKVGLRRAANGEAGKQSDPVQSIGAAAAFLFVGPIVDSVVTPKAVEAAFVADENRPASSLKTLPVTADEHAVIERAGLDTFRVHGTDASKGALVFHLEGLRWKLAGIDLPTA